MNDFQKRLRYVAYSICAGLLLFTVHYVNLFSMQMIPNKVTPIMEFVEALAWGGGPIANILDSLLGVQDIGTHMRYISPIAVVLSLAIKLFLLLVVFESILYLMNSRVQKQKSSSGRL